VAICPLSCCSKEGFLDWLTDWARSVGAYVENSGKFTVARVLDERGAAATKQY
jgi:hypothetical protein